MILFFPSPVYWHCNSLFHHCLLYLCLHCLWLIHSFIQPHCYDGTAPVGLEPTIIGTKTRCLTIWRRGSRNGRNRTCIHRLIRPPHNHCASFRCSDNHFRIMTAPLRLPFLTGCNSQFSYAVFPGFPGRGLVIVRMTYSATGDGVRP